MWDFLKKGIRFRVAAVMVPLLCLTWNAWAQPPSYTVVTECGISNEGKPIGVALNELVKKNYGGTLYFPPGVYNLTEPIVLPYDYKKNVNLMLDPNALVKTDNHLEALVKVGFSEMETENRSKRMFSFIEGGVFDAEHAERGIWVNGIKQVVSLRRLSVLNCSGKHIEVSCFGGHHTGSSDTKFDNIFIQGNGAKGSYGIYIGEECCDNKISDTFIYYTQCHLYVGSAGVIANNVHILSGYPESIGIQVESGGFDEFNQVYFDTTERDLVIGKNWNPQIIANHCISYAWRGGLGKTFLSRDTANHHPFHIKLSNCIFSLQRKADNFRIFDVASDVIEKDVENKITMTDCVFNSSDKISPFDYSLMMKFDKRLSEPVFDKPRSFKSEWLALGAFVPSFSQNDMSVRFSQELQADLSVYFNSGNASMKLKSSKKFPIQFAYAMKNGLCILFFKPKQEMTLYPEMMDRNGNSSYMSTPSKQRMYGVSDYDITTQQLTLIK